MKLETVLIGPSPRIAVDHAGEGPLVVLMHGIGGNRRNWRDQMPVLAQKYHVVAWDARGYGDSDDYEGPLDFADFNRDLLRVIAHFGAASAHIVGLSMGGMIAQNFYRRHPEKCRSLVLADTRNAFQRHNGAEFLRLREAPLLAGKTPRDIAPGVAKALAGPNCPADALAQLTESIAVLHKDSYLKTLRYTTLIDEAEEFRGRTSYVDMASIRVPTLVICGTEDKTTPPAMSQAMGDGIPGAKLEWIEGAGHLSNIEDPKRFNEALLGFLDSLPG